MKKETKSYKGETQPNKTAGAIEGAMIPKKEKKEERRTRKKKFKSGHSEKEEIWKMPTHSEMRQTQATFENDLSP